MNSSTSAVIATAKGEITGLAFPATVEALIAAGPDFLTKAFRITGVLAANNSVVAIDKTTEFFGGGMGRKLDTSKNPLFSA